MHARFRTRHSAGFLRQDPQPRSGAGARLPAFTLNALWWFVFHRPVGLNAMLGLGMRSSHTDGQGSSPRHSTGQPEASAAAEHQKPIVKVALVGDCQVGKTSLMQRYVEGTFDDSQLATQGGHACCTHACSAIHLHPHTHLPTSGSQPSPSPSYPTDVYLAPPPPCLTPRTPCYPMLSCIIPC